MNRFENKWWLSAASGALLLALQSGAHGAWVIDPAVQASTSYDDNIRLSSTDEEDGLVSTVGAQARVRNVTERSLITGVAGVNFETYSNVEDIDDEVSGYFDFSANRQAERFDFGLRASTRFDTLLRRYQSIPEGLDGVLLDDVGDQSPAGGTTEPAANPGDGTGVADPTALDPDIDDNLLEAQVERQQIIVSPTFGYRLSEITRLQVGYGFYGLRYDSEGHDRGLEDSDSHTVFGLINRQLSTRDSINIRAQASRLEPDEGLEVDNYQATLGWQRRLSPRASILFEVGGRRVESDISNDNGVVFAVRGNFATERGAFRGSVERSILPTAYGDVVEADRINFGYVGAVSETLSFRLNLNAYDTESDTSGRSNSNRKYVTVTPSLSFALSEAWNIALGYTYRWTDRENDPSSASSNSASLALIFRPPSQL